MRRNRRVDSGPEARVRSILHSRGRRFRKHAPIRTDERLIRPDIVFTRARVAVFVDGCFWHRCPVHGNEPRLNTAYWGPKLERNVARDRAVDAALAGAGWTVIRAWEHEQPETVADRVERALSARAAQAAVARALAAPRRASSAEI
jgi:DNA mismatch endonuclease (patch repair protein)